METSPFAQISLVFLLLPCTPGVSRTRAANPAAPADISVTPNVVVRNVEPIGANLTTIAGGTNFAINNHVWNSGFEPIVWRKFVRIDRAGDTWFEWDAEGGPGYWNLAWTGLGNGATVRFYRIVDQGGNPLAYAGGTNMGDATGADHVVFLGQDTIPMPSETLPGGGYVVNDDRDGNEADNMKRVFLSKGGLGLRFGDYAYMKLKTNAIGAETSPPDLRKHFQGDKPFFVAAGGNWRGDIVPHPGNLPAECTEPGETCLTLLPSAGRRRARVCARPSPPWTSKAVSPDRDRVGSARPDCR